MRVSNTEGWELAWSLRIPEPTVLINQLNRWQYMKQAWRVHAYKQRLQWHVLAAAGKKPQRPLHACWIHVERANPKPFPDPDGLTASLKPLLDVLICPRGRKPYGLGFIVDDSPQYLQRLTAESVVAPKKQGYTHVYIYRPAAGTQQRAA